MARDSHKLYDHKTSKKYFGSEEHGEREKGGGDASMSQEGSKREAERTAGRGEPTLDKGRTEKSGDSGHQPYRREERREERHESGHEAKHEGGAKKGNGTGGKHHETAMRHGEELKEMQERHHEERTHKHEEHRLQHENMAERHKAEEHKMAMRHADELGVGEEASGAPTSDLAQAAQSAGAQNAPQAMPASMGQTAQSM